MNGDTSGSWQSRLRGLEVEADLSIKLVHHDKPARREFSSEKRAMWRTRQKISIAGVIVSKRSATPISVSKRVSVIIPH